MPADRCDRLLHDAIAEARGRAPDEAYEILDRIRVACPARSGPLSELAGIRFSERRWRDAADLAEQAIARDAADHYASEVLASSRFLQADHTGALRAWNQIDKPRVNLVQIDGLTRTRFQTVAAAMGLEPNMLLTERAFRLAERRLRQLPGGAAARLTFRPEPDGFVTVKATLVERDGPPRGAAAWAVTAIQAAVDREARAAIPGSTGQGEVWAASWRWWNDRPRVALAFVAPKAGKLPGVWRVDASWDTQTYIADGAGPTFDESRVHGALVVSDWLAADVRYSMTGGIDSWRGPAYTEAPARRAPFVGGTLERRWLEDRWSLAGTGTAWIAASGGSGFQAVSLRGAFRSSRAAEEWVHLAEAGVERASDNAPLGIWPGAGEGHARDVLLRAHPLLENGAIAFGDGAVFGRTLVHAHAETQRWIRSAVPVRLGIAAFTDFARASRRAPANDTITQLDIGAGLRLRIPGSEGTLRIDVAQGTRDGRTALTIGWQQSLR